MPEFHTENPYAPREQAVAMGYASIAAACGVVSLCAFLGTALTLCRFRRLSCVMTVLFLTLSLIFPWSSPVRAAAPSRAAVTLPYGGLVPEDTVRIFARTAAWLAALRPAARKLESRTVVQLGAATLSRRLALTAAVFTPEIRFSPDDGAPEGEVTATVRLPAPSDLPSGLRTALRHPEVLALYTRALDVMEKNVSEGQELAERAAELRQRHGYGAEHIFTQRMQYLAARLEALNIYTTVLRQLRGRWEDPVAAARELQRAVALDKNNPLLWCALGEAQLQQDLPQGALESLDKALALMPDMARALYFRGLAQLRLQQSSLAEADLTAALRLRPDMPQWLRTRGAIRMVRKDYGPMCEDFYRACMLGDCDGLEAARKRLQCLPNEEATRTAEKVNTQTEAEQAVPPQNLSSSQSAASAALLLTQQIPVSRQETTPPAALPRQAERIVADHSTDAPPHPPVLASSAPVDLTTPSPQTARDSATQLSVPVLRQEKTLASQPGATTTAIPTAWPSPTRQAERTVADHSTDAPPHPPVLASSAPVDLTTPSPQTARDSATQLSVPVLRQEKTLASQPGATTTAIPTAWPSPTRQAERTVADHSTDAP